MNLEELLAPVSAESPAGSPCADRLEYFAVTEMQSLLCLRAELEELRRMARGPFEGESAMAERTMAEAAVKRAEERINVLAASVKTADSSRPVSETASVLEEQCTSLLRNSGKDLRLALPLTLAATRARGLAGFLQGLAVFEGLLRVFPDALHPLPDEDDRDDDSERSAVFAELIAGTGPCALLRETVVLGSRAGRLSFRDAEVIDGVAKPEPDGPGATNREHLLAIVQASVAVAQGKSAQLVSKSDVREQLRALHSELTADQETLRRIGNAFREKPVGTPRLVPLLDRMTALIGGLFDSLLAEDAMAQVDRLVSAPMTIAPGGGVVGGGAGGAAASGRGVSQSTEGKTVTREDIRLRLLELAQAMERLEPSHPAPLLMRRAARLLSAKSFFDVIKDMAPDSLSHVERLAGQAAPTAPEQ